MALDKDYVRKVCKLGAGKETCRYLAAGNTGYICLKLTRKEEMDKRVASGKMTAQGDNCEGKTEE